uniref:Uncharacterized protein n=1 Tax=Populus davidiana TaxID=266767 RepID=A0A6M2EHA4_9ROSI
MNYGVFGHPPCKRLVSLSCGICDLAPFGRQSHVIFELNILYHYGRIVASLKWKLFSCFPFQAQTYGPTVKAPFSLLKAKIKYHIYIHYNKMILFFSCPHRRVT